MHMWNQHINAIGLPRCPRVGDDERVRVEERDAPVLDERPRAQLVRHPPPPHLLVVRVAPARRGPLFWPGGACGDAAAALDEARLLVLLATAAAPRSA